MGSAIASRMLGIDFPVFDTGILLFGLTMLINKQLGIRGAGINDPTTAVQVLGAFIISLAVPALRVFRMARALRLLRVGLMAALVPAALLLARGRPRSKGS